MQEVGAIVSGVGHGFAGVYGLIMGHGTVIRMLA
jgi:hypothetical protein